MLDAESDNPLCDDIHARAFMKGDALHILDAFREERNPNASTVARHRIIDDLLRQDLSAHPDLTIVTIGTGFDSRPYRIDGGRWVELDEPQVIHYKNECLPASDCDNELERIAIDFSSESLEEKLGPFAGRNPVVVVIEGVFMYLEEAAIEETLRTLQRLFPGHGLICDLMTRDFFETSGRTLHEKITGLGTSFRFTVDNPEEMFLENGYRSSWSGSIVERAAEAGMIPIPPELFRSELRSVAIGYMVYRFEAE
jgi:methyltransferase (TIGR00027 family)